MKLSVVIAQTTDIDILLRFMQEYYAYDHLPFDAQAARDALGRILKDESLGRVWVLQGDGTAAGYMVLTFWYSLEFHGRAAFVDELYVREEYRGRGIGRKALQHAEDFCASLGIKALRLEVEHGNTRALGLYRRTGFVEHDRSIMTKWLLRRS